MDEQRKKALAQALGQIEKQFGKGSVMRMGDGGVVRDIEVVSTGSIGLDVALGVGGLLYLLNPGAGIFELLPDNLPLIGNLDEAAATTAPSQMPWGAPTTVAAGLMDMGLKTFVAYRMQFFLYVKACGVADIGPANCWAGVDMPKQEDRNHP